MSADQRMEMKLPSCVELVYNSWLCSEGRALTQTAQCSNNMKRMQDTLVLIVLPFESEVPREHKFGEKVKKNITHLSTIKKTN